MAFGHLHQAATTVRDRTRRRSAMVMNGAKATEKRKKTNDEKEEEAAAKNKRYQKKRKPKKKKKNNGTKVSQDKTSNRPGLQSREIARIGAMAPTAAPPTAP